MLLQVRSPGDEVLVGAGCRLLVYDVPGGNLLLCLTRFSVPIVKVRIFIAMENLYILLCRCYAVIDDETQEIDHEDVHVWRNASFSLLLLNLGMLSLN